MLLELIFFSEFLSFFGDKSLNSNNVISAKYVPFDS
jgi:hypothetical protein